MFVFYISRNDIYIGEYSVEFRYDIFISRHRVVRKVGVFRYGCVSIRESASELYLGEDLVQNLPVRPGRHTVM